MNTLVKHLPLAILLTTIVISCTKEGADPSVPVCVVSSIKLDTMETTMKYDAAGRVLRVTDFDSLVERGSATFEYAQGTITERDSIPATATHPAMRSNTITHIIGSNGFVSASYFTDYPGARDTIYYTYDSNGYLTRSVRRYYLVNPGNVQSFSYSETHDYTIAGGNRVKDSLTWRGYQDYERVTLYTYYAGQSNYNGINFMYYYDYPFLGKKNVSLVKTSVDTHSLFPATSTTFNYSYQFDTDGKPVKAILTNATGSDTYRFGYTCQ